MRRFFEIANLQENQSGSDGCAAEWIPIGAEHTLYVLDSDNGPQTSVAYTHHKEIGKEMMGYGQNESQK